ncbi:Extracellular membrane protein, CFEM domain [Fusarium oxysporum f. sp. vasinfectum]|nr:Extracellular membrane protein, CFEM domain [Fusarium oxysporum f. sp. vasinfectum]KAK2933400.1 Extracellular membrane protein, CFEM domain [Fusarium oxysporum f. sp. vasinfectum]
MTVSRRFLILGTLCLLYDTTAAQSLDSMLTDAPKCAVDCLTELLSQKEYAQMGQEAMCSSKPFSKAMGVCLMTKCSMRQTMDFIKESSAACGIPPTNNTNEYRLNSTVVFAFALVFFALRIVTKFRLGLTWGIDDTLTTLSVLFIVIEVLYLTALVLVKAAILCFFLRIFPDHKFSIVVKCTMVFNALIWVGFFIFVFFQTQPFSLFWNGWQQKKGHLILTGFTNFTLPLAGMNLLLDIWMLILPMTQLWGMGLKLRKKLGVISMFSVGIFLTIVAAIRVRELVAFLLSEDLTVDHAQSAVIWSNVEISVGVMVACMPHIRHLVRHITSRIRARKGTETKHKNRKVFVDRSLATIEVGDSQAIELNDEGGLLTANTCTTASSATKDSKTYGSVSFASDGDTQV